MSYLVRSPFFRTLTLVAMILSALAPGAVGQANVQGQWNTLLYLMPINPVHAALLHNGKVLIVSGSGNCPPTQSGCPSGAPYGPANKSGAAIWDPVAGTITQFTLNWDMFCNGMVVLLDGRAFINGGTLQYDPFHGALGSSVFDPSTNTFTDVQTMAAGRWYPTVTNLGDGRVMAFSGLDQSGGTNSWVEFYSPGFGWTQPYPAGWTPPLYPRMHLLPNGKVFYSGSGTSSALFDPSTQSWTSNVAATKYGNVRTYGSSVLLPLTPVNNYDPKVMIMGGGNPATATTEIIDLGVPSPAWQFGPNMSQARIEMNATILPNGKVLAMGGSLNDEDTTNPSLNADLIGPDPNNPGKYISSTMAANAYARLYHSVALLLPDATVWFAGGNPSRGSYEQHMEIYKPPYLFNPDGTLAVRPTITGAPGSIGYGNPFTVQTPDAAAISQVVLVRPGVPTHAFDQDQRLVGLSFTAGNGTLTVTAPPNGNIAPPGYYMLFILNTSGVPSVAQMVQLVGAQLPNPNLVAAYSFNEGLGTTVGDSSGLGNTGTVSNTTWTTSGKFGNALVFNGTSALVTIPDAASLHLTNGMTIEAWVNPSAVTNAWRDVIYKGNDNYYLEGSSENSSRPAGGGTWGSGGPIYGTAALTVNTWAHVALTYDGANLRLYVNGTQVASQARTGNIATSTNPLQIGGDSLYGQYFQGTIDEVRVYNVALTATQIQSDMATPIGSGGGGDTQAPTAPTNLGATVVSASQINLSWTASTDNVGVTGYLVERCQLAGCNNFAQIGTATGTTYNDTGLTANTSYSYRVRATDAAGNLSPYSNVASATTQTSNDTQPPTAPTNLGATAVSGSQINLSWTASTDNVGVTGYRVERCQLAGCNNFAQIGTATGTTYNDTGLTANTSYSYRVRATDAAGNLSPYSNVASATTQTSNDTQPPTAPTNLGATAVSGSQINLSWTASTDNVGVTGYLVERCQGSGCNNFAQIGTTPGTTYNDTGLTGGTSYSYRVRATDAAGNLSPYSNVASAITFLPTAPANLSAVPGGPGPVVATVQSYLNSTFLSSHTTAPFDSTGGDLIVLLASSHFGVTLTPSDNFGNAWISVAGPTNTSLGFDLRTQMWYAPSPIVGPGHTVTMNLSQGMSLAMSVIVVKGSNTSSPIDAVSLIGSDNGTQTVNVASPNITTTGTNDLLAGFAKVSAGAVFQAGTGFTSQPGASSNFLAAETRTGATPGTYNATFTLDTQQTWQSIVVAAANNANQTTLSWTASTEVGGTIANYLVERCQGAGCSSFVQVGTSTTTTFNDKGLTPNTSYSYRARAQDTNNNVGPYSNVASVTTPVAIPSLPGNLTATSPSNTEIDLSWIASTEAGGAVSSYLIERCQGANCTNFVQVGTSVGTNYNDTGLTTGTTYNYRVRAKDTGGNLSPYSNLATATAQTPDTQPPTAPSNLTATAVGSGQINLSWTASTDNVGVTGYFIERCQGAGCTTFFRVAVSNTNTYSDTGLTNGTSYSYRVRATDAAGNLSAYSNTATATAQSSDTQPPTAPTNLGATAVSSSQINLSWTASTDNVGVTGYLVERCQGSGCNNFAQIATTPGTTYNNTGLASNTSYSYRVRATDAAGNLSTYSNAASATTQAGGSGLVAAYSFNEGTGTAVADSSGTGNTGTVSNTTWTTSGKYGNALVFNGTSSLVTIPDSTSLHLANGMTIEAWVNPSVVSSAWRDVVYKGNDVYYLEGTSDNSSKPAGGGTWGSSHGPIYGTTALTSNTWAHLALTYDGANLRLYVNGTQVASKAQTGNFSVSTNPVQIGGDSIFGQYFQGTIDEVRVYNIALTATQIQSDMNTPIGSGGGGDTQPPTAPTNLGATAVSTSQINLSWTASTDNVGVTGYLVERCQGSGCNNFAQIGTSTGTTYNDTGLQANTSYSYRVRARDAAGNLSGYSNVASAVTNATLTVTPRAAALTFTRTQQFTAIGGTVTWSVDGVLGGSTSSGTITTGGLYTPPNSVGTHIVTATTTDQSQSASAAVYITNYAGTFTHHNDNLRTGQNTNETVLTPSRVNQTQFGKLFSYAMDGIAFASPLYVANVSIPGQGFHNVVYAATEHDSVYAWDADGLSTNPLWKVSFLGGGVKTVPCGDTGECGDIPNEIGITGTPAIDSASGTLYVVAKTKEGSGYVQRLHALDITTGAERSGSPVVIQASVSGSGEGSSGGQLSFDPLRENQRPALILSNGVVYIGWGSHGDQHPWHGWVIGYNATTLQQVVAYSVSPDGYGGGVWASGGGLATDSTGNIFFNTGNGDFNVNTGGRDYGDSIVKLSPSGTVVDYFTPYDQANLESQDLDLASAGPVLLVDQPGTFPHLLITAAKGGTIYVVNRDNMGHFNQGSDSQIVQSLVGILPHGTLEEGNFTAPAYFNGYVYFAAVNDYLKAFQLTNGLLSNGPTSRSVDLYPNRGGAFAVSANGNTNGIVWAVLDNNPSSGVLFAYDATNLGNEFYDSNQAGSRDTLGVASKFSIPLVANGKVFVGAQGQLVAYGLLP